MAYDHTVPIEIDEILIKRVQSMYQTRSHAEAIVLAPSLVSFWEHINTIMPEQDPERTSGVRYWWHGDLECDPLRGPSTYSLGWPTRNTINSICIAVRDCYTYRLTPSMLDNFMYRQINDKLMTEMAEALAISNRLREDYDPSFVASPRLMLGVMLGVLPVSALGKQAWGPFVADCCNRIRSRGMPVPPELHDVTGGLAATSSVKLVSTIKPEYLSMKSFGARMKPGVEVREGSVITKDMIEDIDVGEHIQMHNPNLHILNNTPRQHQWREREAGRIYDLYKMIPVQSFEHKVASVKRIKALQIDGDDTWMCVVQLPERLWIRAGLVSAEAAMDLANVAINQEEKGGEMNHGLYKRRPKITKADVFFAVVFALGSIVGFATTAQRWNLLLFVAAIVLAFASPLSLLGAHLSHWWIMRGLTR